MRVVWVRFNRKEKVVIYTILVLLLLGGGASAFFLGGAPVGANCKEDTSPYGLVGWWKLDGNTNDSSPYHDNGTALSGAAPTSDRAGNSNCAYSFGGGGQRIDIPSNSALNTSVFTYTAWINVTTTTVDTMIGNTTFGGPQFRVNNGKLELLSETVASLGTGTTSLSTGTWYNVAVSYSSSGAYVFYVNGVAGGSGTNLHGFSFGQIEIGTRNSGSAESFSGSMDDVRMYNRVLSATEIKSIANETNPGISLASGESGLVGWWKMDSNAKDSTPYGDNGTVTGATLTTDREGAANSAYSFTAGSSQSINLGTTVPSITGGDFSLSVWAKSSSGVATPTVFSQNIPAAWPNSLFILYYGDSSVSNGIRVWWSGSSIISYSTSVADNTWHNVVLTRSGSTFTLYKDGTQIATGSSATNFTSTNSYIGGENDAGTINQFYNGSLDDVRIWKRALSTTEIANLFKSYNSQVSVSSLESGELGDWPFNGNARDNTPYGDNGTVTSATLTTDREGRANSAYSFNGTSSRINVPITSFPTSMTATTASFWAKPTSGVVSSVLSSDADSGTNRYNVHLPWSDNTIYWDFGNISVNGRLTASFNAAWFNVWSMWTFTADSTGMRIYRNGVQIATTTNHSTFTTTGKTMDFGYFSGGPSYWPGSIDDMRIWNRALSAAEITALYKEYR